MPTCTIGRTTEQKLILLCATTRLDDPRRALAGALLARPLDWDYITDNALIHGVAPLLLARLLEFPGMVPKPVVDALRARLEPLAQRNLLLTAELVSIATLYAEAGIRALAYKGPALALDAYGDLGLRQFSDIDIIVPRADAPTAIALLKERGYQDDQEAPLTPDQRQRFWDYEHHVLMTHPARGTAVEVHWAFAPYFFAFDFSFEDAWQNRVASPLGNGVQTLNRADTLLTLATHGARHGWRRLEWIVDIAELLRTDSHDPKVDWPALHHRARALGMQRTLNLALLLAAELQGDWLLPPAILRHLRADPMLPALSREVWTPLFANRAQEQGELSEHWLNLRARDSYNPYLWRVITRPTRHEFQRRPLPPHLFWMYPVLRLWHAAGKVGRMLLRRPDE